MKKMLICVIIATGLCLSAAQAAEIKMAPKVSTSHKVMHKPVAIHGMYVTKRVALLRNHPSRKGKIIAHIKRGTLLSIQSCDRYKWCKVKGKKAYLSMDSIRKVKIIKK